MQSSDVIVFINNLTKKKMRCKIENKILYEKREELLQKESSDSIIFTTDNIRSAICEKESKGIFALYLLKL